MKGYGQFCPVAVAAEIFAGRWTPLGSRSPAEYGPTKAGEEFRDQNLDVSVLAQQAFPGWLRLSHEAHVARPAHAG